MDEAEGERDFGLSKALWNHDHAYIQAAVASGFDLDTPVRVWARRTASLDDWRTFPPLPLQRCLLVHMVQRAIARQETNTALFRVAFKTLPFSRAAATRALVHILTRPWTPKRRDHYAKIAQHLLDGDARLPPLRELQLRPNLEHYDVPLRVYKRLDELVADRNQVRGTIRTLYGIARFRVIPGLPIRDLVRFIGNTLLPLPR